MAVQVEIFGQTYSLRADADEAHVRKVADLVVYSADPSVDITRLRTPEFVVRGGWVDHNRSPGVPLGAPVEQPAVAGGLGELLGL